jgi:hypothetical protein
MIKKATGRDRNNYSWSFSQSGEIDPPVTFLSPYQPVVETTAGYFFGAGGFHLSSFIVNLSFVIEELGRSGFSSMTNDKLTMNDDK